MTSRTITGASLVVTMMAAAWPAHAADALAGLKHRALHSGKAHVVEALKVLEREGMLAQEMPAAGDAVEPSELMEAVTYFEEKASGSVLGLLTAWNAAQPAASTRHLMWAQYDEGGRARLRVGDTIVVDRTGVCYGEAEDYAGDAAGTAIEVVAYTVWACDASGNITSGTVEVNGSAVGAYGSVHVYETWVDAEKKKAVALCTVGEEMVLCEVPLLSAIRGGAARPAQAPRRPVSQQELEQWAAAVEPAK